MQEFLERLFAATPRTWVTTSIIVLNTSVWVLTLLAGADVMNPRPQRLLELGGSYLPATLDQPWRLFTSTILHAGVLHLAFNMWALSSMGRIAERFYGNGPFLLLYLLSGLFGALASLFFAAREAVSVGASGAIFGVTGAWLAALVTKPHKLPAPLVRSMRGSLLFFIGYSLFMGFTTSVVDNAAHIGGLVAGFAIATIMAERFDWDEYHRHGHLRAAIAVAISIFAAYGMWRLAARPLF
ncbi:MAG: rhomboid family intramembrane serine protease [Burkholderiaceae bacterium]